MSDRKKETKQVGEIIISEIIGERPRKPASYNIRKARKTKTDLEFCADYDRRLKEWQEKADELRRSQIKDYPNYEEKPKKNLNIPSEVIINDFKRAFKHLQKKEFKDTNPYSDTDEPIIFLKTLVYYFNRDERFFKSPLLRKDLSEPSFDKGTLSIGMYGGGKTTTYSTLIWLFKDYCKDIVKMDIGNKEELLSKFKINKVVAKDVVLDYKDALKDFRRISDILLPLKTVHDLYIDDLLKEEILFQTKDRSNEVNIFKDYLTLRDERGRRTHLSINYKEYKDKNGDVCFENTEKSLEQIRDKYNGTVHDRIFGSYNILELKGKSLRR